MMMTIKIFIIVILEYIFFEYIFFFVSDSNTDNFVYIYVYLLQQVLVQVVQVSQFSKRAEPEAVKTRIYKQLEFTRSIKIYFQCHIDIHTSTELTTLDQAYKYFRIVVLLLANKLYIIHNNIIARRCNIARRSRLNLNPLKIKFLFPGFQEENSIFNFLALLAPMFIIVSFILSILDDINECFLDNYFPFFFCEATDLIVEDLIYAD